jgi:hypothetical protein
MLNYVYGQLNCHSQRSEELSPCALRYENSLGSGGIAVTLLTPALDGGQRMD